MTIDVDRDESRRSLDMLCFMQHYQERRFRCVCNYQLYFMWRDCFREPASHDKVNG